MPAESPENVYSIFQCRGKLGIATVRVFSFGSSCCEFNSRLGRYQVTTLGKSFTRMCRCHQAV